MSNETVAMDCSREEDRRAWFGEQFEQFQVSEREEVTFRLWLQFKSDPKAWDYVVDEIATAPADVRRAILIAENTHDQGEVGRHFSALLNKGFDQYASAHRAAMEERVFEEQS